MTDLQHARLRYWVGVLAQVGAGWCILRLTGADWRAAVALGLVAWGETLMEGARRDGYPPGRSRGSDRGSR